MSDDLVHLDKGLKRGSSTILDVLFDFIEPLRVTKKRRPDILPGEGSMISPNSSPLK